MPEKKVIEKKRGEAKEEMPAAVALVHPYVPPDPGMMHDTAAKSLRQLDVATCLDQRLAP
jgi:hypothetical protein